MTRLPRLLPQALLLLALLTGQALANPCALPGDGVDGMGGTGIGGSGMGGTGQRPGDGDGSGMGGTGNRGDGSGTGGTGGRADGSGMGGTGVVGVITGFGSICVNGLEVFYGADTPVTLDGEAASAETLAVGQVVSVWAIGRDGRLHARHVAVNSALVGPVTWVAGDGRALVAMGQLVRLPAAGDAAGGLPKVGDNVRVSGLRGPDGAVLATRLEWVSEQARPSVSGAVDLVAGKLARVGGLLVRGLPEARAGDQLRVSGPLVGGIMQADRVQPDPLLAPVRGVERLSLQGVAQGPANGGGLSLGYARLAAPAGAPRLTLGSVVRVEARTRADGGLELTRVLEAREPAGGERSDDARRDRRSGDGQGRPGGARDEKERTGLDRHTESHGERKSVAGRQDREEAKETRPEVERPERGERVEKAEVEKPEVEKPEVEKVEVEKPEVEKVELEKVEVEKVEVEKVEVEKVEVEKVEVEKIEVEKVEVEKVEVEKVEKPEKPEREERRERD